MVVNTTFVGSNKPRVVAIGTRQRPVAVNIPKEAMRQHEQAMEYRRRNTELAADLKSATDALATANKDIERLNVEIRRLQGEIGHLTAMNNKLTGELNAAKSGDAPAPKYRKRKNKDPQPEVPVEQSTAESAPVQ
jgi:chromosome segregation ATPase